MVLSLFGRCCLGFALISAAGLNLVHGQEESVDRFELLLEKLTKLAEDVKKIKNSTSEILRYLPECRVREGKLICRTESCGDGWIVIQQRFDGSVNFDRYWSEYRSGFGAVGPSTEFWWGLERLHEYTKNNEYELLLEFKDDQDEYRFARYSEFVVEGESKKYRLAKLGGYSGTAGDINEYADDRDLIPTGRYFSTLYNDNDDADVNCAAENGGGWWYGWCGYGPNSKWNSNVKWIIWKNEVLHYTRMLIRRKA